MRAWLLTVALLGGAGCGGDPDDGKVFIALQSDFADFRTWERIPLGDTPLDDGHTGGPRVGWLKMHANAPKYPVGSMIVKTVEVGPTPQEWDVFSMVKRGGGINQGAAAGWEFFLIKINADDVPVITSRGTNPTSGDNDGHSYGDILANGFTCNRCHGISGTDATDHVLSPLLQPGT